MYVILYEDGGIGFEFKSYNEVRWIAEDVIKLGSNPVAILKIRIKIK